VQTRKPHLLVDVFQQPGSNDCVKVRHHVLKHHVDVAIVVRLHHVGHQDNVLVAGKLLQKHDFSERPLCICRILERVKNLLDGHKFLRLLVNGLPDDSWRVVAASVRVSPAINPQQEKSLQKELAYRTPRVQSFGATRTFGAPACPRPRSDLRHSWRREKRGLGANVCAFGTTTSASVSKCPENPSKIPFGRGSKKNRGLFLKASLFFLALSFCGRLFPLVGAAQVGQRKKEGRRKEGGSPSLLIAKGSNATQSSVRVPPRLLRGPGRCGDWSASFWFHAFLWLNTSEVLRGKPSWGAT
jgi:hypothetical protein